MDQIAFSFLAPASVEELLSTLSVRRAFIGRPNRKRLTMRGVSTFLRAIMTQPTSTTAASTVSLFAQFKGSPNSERMLAYLILQFFNSFIEAKNEN